MNEFVNIPESTIRERNREIKNKSLKPFIKTERKQINLVYRGKNKRRNVFFITHDKRKYEEMKNLENEKMEFVETSTIPAKTTKKGTEWLEIFGKIPVGKSWLPNMEKYKTQSIRSARADLEKKGLLKYDISVTQRTENGKLVLYVSNVGLKQTATPTKKP